MSRPADASSSHGVYSLILRCDAAQRLAVGRLGEMLVRPGYYVYVGSALGPGGLAGRLHHHLSPMRKPYWHIDYLRQAAYVVDIWYAPGAERREHNWARLLMQTGGAIATPRFGASDCACPAHLFFFETRPSFAAFGQALAAAIPGAACSRWTTPGSPGRADGTQAQELAQRNG